MKYNKLILAIVLLFATKLSFASASRMPEEYQTLKKYSQKIAYLHENYTEAPIAFSEDTDFARAYLKYILTIVTKSYTFAELCPEEIDDIPSLQDKFDSYFFSNIRPACLFLAAYYSYAKHKNQHVLYQKITLQDYTAPEFKINKKGKKVKDIEGMIPTIDKGEPVLTTTYGESFVPLLGRKLEIIVNKTEGLSDDLKAVASYYIKLSKTTGYYEKS